MTQPRLDLLRTSRLQVSAPRVPGLRNCSVTRFGSATNRHKRKTRMQTKANVVGVSGGLMQSACTVHTEKYVFIVNKPKLFEQLIVVETCRNTYNLFSALILFWLTTRQKRTCFPSPSRERVTHHLDFSIFFHFFHIRGRKDAFIVVLERYGCNHKTRR